MQQLSKQDHYDFGLRALVSVLRYAGRKKRSNPNMPDEEVSMRLTLGKGGLMHMPKVLSQISLCSLLRLIRDNIFRLYWIVYSKRILLKQDTRK
ncbi:hypothetical protein DPMN_184968 [Dreissena polymorpha]|uniref:Dynein heavy chain hydrolytic ATP-binding dynein motor region domain-containing protein n=1 Tax=Dreissena polymorpha TaxID=45954 RepID=A0A9D4I6V6_DREPO|nr:hypothetical protein DPMN_184968 [Dreissena polymorpha]